MNSDVLISSGKERYPVLNVSYLRNFFVNSVVLLYINVLA